MEQEKIEILLKILADVIKTIENGGAADHLTSHVKQWLHENAPEYLK